MPGGHDRQMIIADDKGEVGVAGLQREDHRVIAVGGNGLNRVDDRLGRRFRLLAAMMVYRGDNVSRLQGLAIVEFHALTQVEAPLPGVRRRFPGLGECAKGGERTETRVFASGR